MAKTDTKKKDGKRDKAAAGAAEAVEAVRAAVERTFVASAEGAKSTRGRAKDVTTAANRIREVLEERVLNELKGLRGDLEGLAKRVQELELGPLHGASKPAASKPASTARKPPASRSTAARKTPASRSTTARKSTASKPAASRSTAARKSTASKSRSTTARKPAASRSTTTRKPSSGAGGTTSGT